MDRKGFTVLELLMTLALGVIVLGAVYAALVSTQKSAFSLEQKISSHQDVRGAIEIMASEIRMASYNPNCNTGIWLDSGCGTSSFQSNKGIQQATSATVTVEMDTDDSGVIGDGTNEMITYHYDSANQYITRKSKCGNADPFLGDSPGSGRPRNVLVVNDSVNKPIFTYYDGNGSVISDPSSNTPAIRRIEITLIVDTADVAHDTGQRRRTIYTTSVIPRNHAYSSY